MKAINIPANVSVVLDRLEFAGFEAYIVGGCVRDAVMSRTPKDYDVCTSALPHQVLNTFRDSHVIETGLQHGTVTVMSDNEPIEVTTYRTDGAYSDSRHPDKVEFVSSLTEDLKRRDFTMNAMAYHPQKGLVDPFGGQEDIAKGILKCVGNPQERFTEDALRILRALRFASRFQFKIHEDTSFAILEMAERLDNISKERISSELIQLLMGDGVTQLLLDYKGVIAVFIPEIKPCFGFDQKSQ